MNKKQAFRDALVAGIFISLSLLTNSMILGFVPFLIIWFFFTYKEKKISPKYIVLILSVVCLALVLKTFMLKDPIGDRGAAYRGFWLWNNPYKKSDEKYVLPSHPGFHEYKQSLNKTDAELKVLFLNYVKDYPLEYIKGAWYRFLLFWHFDSQSVRSGARWKYQVVGFLSYGMFVPFFLLGLCLSFKDWKKSLIFYLLFFYFTLVAVLLSSGIRKRIPIEPFIFMYVAYSMSWLWDKIYKTKNHLRK